MHDIVVDTCVFVHACNWGEAHHEDALEFLIALLESGALLCVDAPPIGEERGKILNEYVQQRILEFQRDEGIVIRALIQSDRIVEIEPCRIDHNVLGQALHDASDHVFFRVAAASRERALVSHDVVFRPTDRAARRAMRSLNRTHRVRVLSAADAAVAL